MVPHCTAMSRAEYQSCSSRNTQPQSPRRQEGDTRNRRSVQRCNPWPLPVLPWTRTTQQHRKQLWNGYGLSASILKHVAIAGCLRTLQGFRVCHLALCSVRSATPRSKGEKTPRRSKLFLSSFNVPVSSAAAFCNSKSWKTWTLSASLLSSFRL